MTKLWTIRETSEEIKAGRLTPVDLLEQCLEQIDRYESRVRAWVLVDRERAMEDAKALTTELSKGNHRGPLHGIPLGVKDIIDVFDWPTACGSKLWTNSIARQDADVVARLRQAGAVFVGKTVTTQYASFDPPPTRNPWNLQRTPGGSSSGSAAAVACGMCLGALATQTGGSITRPASYCGVASFKPSYRTVSTDGVLPLADSMDHVGAMASGVWDLAFLSQTMGCMKFRDDLLCGWNANNESPKLGRFRGLFEELADPEVRDFMEVTCQKLQNAGATIKNLTLPAGFATILENHRTVMAVEAAKYHELRLRRHPDDYGPCITQLLQEGLACPATRYARCKEDQSQLNLELMRLFVTLDGILTPATTCPAPDAATTGNPAFNSPWSYTGYPTVSIPAAFSKAGLPLALQLIGTQYVEQPVFQAATWCEQILGWQPKLPPAS